MADYIPNRDNDLLVFATTLAAWCQANGAANGLSGAQISDINTLTLAFGAALIALDAAENAYDASVATKRAARVALEAIIRLCKGVMEPNLDPVERAAAGFVHTSALSLGNNPPPSKPVMQIDTRYALAHKINFADEGTPTSRAKPPGVHHIEIYVKIGGAAPTSLADCVYAGIDSRTPFDITFNGEHAGKMAHYLGRWVGHNGKAGPTSEVHSATITGV